MNKEEILNDEFVEKEITQTKSRKKIKIAISIIASMLIIATTTLLIGHFKFHWFESEIYTLDVNISRNVYQAEHFTETKTIKTKLGFSNGESDERTNLIKTNFMVIETDKKQTEKGFLNTAFLIIKESQLNQGEIHKVMTSFDISNPNVINEFKANPNGAKYPMAFFSFYEDGKINEIKLPNNMDKYNANSIIELIESVIPKLTRNKTEDISNGLKIVTKKDKKKKTLVESQAPKEVPEFKGSRFAKSVKREIEEDKLTNIATKTKVNLVSEKNEDVIEFGIKDFDFTQESEIISTGIKEDKENSELIKELSKYLVFVKSDDLIKTFEEKVEKQVIQEWEEDITSPDSKLRKLGFASKFNFQKSIHLKTLSFLGTTVNIDLVASVSGGSAKCQLVVSSSMGTLTAGTGGITFESSRTYNTGDITLFSFKFPPVPAIGINLKAGGSASYSIYFDSSAQTLLKLSCGGTIYAKAGISVSAADLAGVEGGAKGTIISGTAYFNVNSGGGCTKSGSINAGSIYVYASGEIIGKEIFYKEYPVFDGWTYNL